MKKNYKLTVDDLLAAYQSLSLPDQRRFRGALARRDRDRFLIARAGLVHSYLRTFNPPIETLADWKPIRDYLATLYPALLARRWPGDMHAEAGRPVSPRALRDGYFHWRERWEAARHPAVL